MALLAPWQVKPAGPVRVNQGHPLARDMAAFLVYAGGFFYDALTQRASGTLAGQTVVNTSEGRALHYDGATRIVFTPTRNTAAVTPHGASLIARIRPTAKPAGNAWAVNYYDTAALDKGPLLGVNSSGFAIAGGGASGGTAVVANATDMTNVWYTIGANHGAVAGNYAGYLNGMSLGNATNGGDGTTSTATSIALGKEGGNYDNFFTGDIAWVAAFNRLLSADEHWAFAINPFAVLEQKVNKRFFAFSQPAPAGGGISGTLAATLDAATLSSAATLKLQAQLAVLLGDATLSSAATLKLQAQLAATLQSVTLSSAAALKLQAQLAVLLGDATLSATGTGTLSTTGQLAALLGDATLSSAATLKLQAQLAATLAGANLFAAGKNANAITTAFDTIIRQRRRRWS